MPGDFRLPAAGRLVQPVRLHVLWHLHNAFRAEWRVEVGRKSEPVGRPFHSPPSYSRARAPARSRTRILPYSSTKTILTQLNSTNLGEPWRVHSGDWQLRGSHDPPLRRPQLAAVSAVERLVWRHPRRRRFRGRSPKNNDL